MKQVAINDIGSAEDFMRAIDESMKKFKNGDLVSGTIVQISREGVLVDIGYKTEGFIPKSELSVRRDFDIHDIVQIGQEVEALVLSLNKEDDQYILSLKDGELENIWNDLQNRYELSIPLVGKVIKMVKGGLIVDIGIKAFLPGSLVEINRVDDFSSYIGQDLEFIINQFDRKTIISPYDRIFYGKHKYFEPAFEKIKNRNNIYNKLFDNLLYKCEKNYSNISYLKNLF